MILLNSIHQNLPKELQIGERAMLERLRSGNSSLQDIEFYLHELKESAIFRQTGELSSAHKNALQWRSATERDLFHQSIIDANKEIFPIKWRENYEFNAHPPKPNI